jgi:hypothetical protein
VPTLPELTRTLERRLDAIVKTGARSVGFGGVSQIVAMQLLESGSDIDAAGRALLDAHRRAIRPFQEGGAGRPVPANAGRRTLLRQSVELQTLSVLYKAWLFFVRSFCDNAYRLLLAELEGKPARPNASMASILNPLNPVAVLLAAEAPDVAEWFRERRDLRNDMKRGAAFAFSRLDARGLHLTIFEITPTETPNRAIDVAEGTTLTLADIAEDAERVLEILQVLAARREAAGAQTGAHVD